MFLVGMFGARGVDSRVSGAKEAEDEEEEAGNDEGIDYRGVDGVLLDLHIESLSVWGTFLEDMIIKDIPLPEKDQR